MCTSFFKIYETFFLIASYGSLCLSFILANRVTKSITFILFYVTFRGTQTYALGLLENRSFLI